MARRAATLAAPAHAALAPRRAVLYTRVSTSEQADHGYSLRDQEARLRAYCERAGVAVAGHYQDDASAKTFDRPQWQAMRRRLETDGRRFADAVLVVKWDRLSRDATGALAELRALERLGVAVQATEQPIDRSVPEQLMMLAIYVAAPEVENRRRSMSVRAGMRRAMLEGRYISIAPVGYRQGRGPDGRPLIQVDEAKAPAVRRAFELAADASRTLEEVRLEIRREGLKAPRSTFDAMLRQVLYAGYVRVPGDGVEPEQLVRGLHVPLVDEALFWAVQRLRYGVRAPGLPHLGGMEDHRQRPRGEATDDLHLRGLLACPDCGGALTGAHSRGKLGTLYAYYLCHHCARRRTAGAPGAGPAFRVRSALVHEALQRAFATISVPPEWRALYREMLAERTASAAAERERAHRQAARDVADAEEKLVALDEALVERRIGPESHARLAPRYADALAAARAALVGAEVAMAQASDPERLARALSVLERPGLAYARAGAADRRRLVGSIIDGKLVAEKTGVRTPLQSRLIALVGPKNAESPPLWGEDSGTVVSTGFEPVLPL